jgi:hypothetical protein
MTKEDAITLTYGQTLHHVSARNRDGTPLRARVNGKPIVRKRTGAFRVPLKHGIKTFFYLTEENLSQWEKA